MLVMEGIPEIPAALMERLRPYQNTRTATVLDWDAGGRGLLIATRFGEAAQVHLVARPGGDRRQITFFNEPIGGAASCPDPEAHGFLFAKDAGGGENFQIHFQDLETGASTLMTDGVSRNVGMRWSWKGDRFAYGSNRRNGRDQDIVVAARTDPRAAKVVLERAGTWNVLDWSPDDRQLLVERAVSVTENHLHLLDLATGALEEITPAGGPVYCSAARFAARGRALWMVCDENSEHRRLRHLDLATKASTDLTADIPWDVEALAVSRKGDRVAFAANEGGYSRLRLLDAATRRHRPVAEVPDGVISSMDFDRDGRRLAFTLESAVSPDDAYVLDLGSGGVTRWTESEVGGLDPARFTAPTVIDYPTFDEVDGAARRIPAFYYKPRGPGPFPVLVHIHGGPEGQARPTFSPVIQSWVNELGIAVLTPNVRGSTGYGRTYVSLDNGYRREDPVRDIGALLDWIATCPELDAQRIGVYGGSYGGYMVLASMTHYPDRLRAAIDVVGISSFVTFLANTSGYRQDLRRVEYGDERDPEMAAFLKRISPLDNVARMRTPVLIVQGKNDPRVPLSESEQMLAALRAGGGRVWYMMAKDEGHGFRKKSNVDAFTGAAARFLEIHLTGSAASGVPAPAGTPAPAGAGGAR
jgi:dipeptidyl aminopeptidase/acylaminoacyl peptidase